MCAVVVLSLCYECNCLCVCVCVCVQISSNSFLVLSFCVLFLIEKRRSIYVHILSIRSIICSCGYIYIRNHHAYIYRERVVVVSMVYAPPSPIYDE